MDHTPYFATLQAQHPEHVDLIHRCAEKHGVPYDPARVDQLARTDHHDAIPLAPSAPTEPGPTDGADSLAKWQQYLAAKRGTPSPETLPPLPPRAATYSTSAPLQGQELMAAVVARRRQLGLTQAGFAERLGISLRTYQEWEQGRRRPSGPAESMLRRAL